MGAALIKLILIFFSLIFGFLLIAFFVSVLLAVGIPRPISTSNVRRKHQCRILGTSRGGEINS